MLKKYKTVLGEGQAELTEKKSRFIAAVMPIHKEEEARTFIESIRKKYWDAAHHVFAYQIGERDEIQRSSDDGEPQGTAGKPVLDVLWGEDLKNTVVVVTRYFGGTLLGTGGLVRAYGKSAKEGVLAAGIIEKILYEMFSIKISYPLSGKVQYEILQQGHLIQDTIYTDSVEYIVLCEQEQKDGLLSSVTEASGGQAEINRIKEVYGVWAGEKLTLE